MLLAVDVGNTQTALCLYRDDELVDHWRLATERSSTADELGVLLAGLLDFESVDGICLASTVPVLVREWEALASKWAHAPLLIVGPGVKTGIPIRYVDQLRRRLARRGVRRRRPRAGNRDLDGRALRACRTSRQGRLRRAAVGHRQDHGRGAPVRARVRVRGAGGRNRGTHPGRARRRRAGGGDRRARRSRRAALGDDRARGSVS